MAEVQSAQKSYVATRFLDGYARMLLIRLFETSMHQLFLAGEVHGTTHLCAGQEAVAVGTCMALRPDDSDHRRGQARATAKSRQITIPGPTQDQMDNGVYPVETVSVHLKVSKGQELAIDTAGNTAEYCSDGTPGQLLFAPTLSVGNAFTSSAGVDDCLLLVQAVVRH